MNIENIFVHLGFLVVDDSSKGDQVSCSFILNRQGEIRFMWNREEKKPLFLKFYSRASIRAKIIYALICLVFFLKLQRLVFKQMSIVVKCVRQKDDFYFDPFQNGWALFTGTAGPDRKFVLFQSGKEKSNTFLKIACSERSAVLIAKEVNALNILRDRKSDNWSFPLLIRSGKSWVELEDISMGNSTGGPWGDSLTDFILDISSGEFSVEGPLHSYGWAQQCKDFLETEENTDFCRGLQIKLLDLLKFYWEEEVCCAPAHGDLTPWNVFQSGNSLGIVDWEYFNDEQPIGFDLFHFFIQSQIHLNVNGNSIVIERLKKEWKLLCSGLEKNEEDLRFECYLASYLLINCTAYIKQYQKKERLLEHEIYAIEFWNQLVSFVLRDKVKSRQLLLHDVFDHLNFGRYACVKFPKDGIEALGTYSDVDILTEKNSVLSLEKSLQNHPLVEKVISRKRFFMTSLLLVLHNQEFLALDLIWSLERKGLQYMQSDGVFKDYVLYDRGIRVFSLKHQFYYFAWFYGLNKALVPDKYKSVKDLVVKENIATVFFKAYKEPFESITKDLSVLLRSKSYNSPTKILFRYLRYLIGEIRLFFNNKGKFISFTGVDGAGKTTIINLTKNLIGKKYRKRCVVLHHRPRILPLLSSLRFGKKKAEERSRSQLPRVGGNTSTVGSFLRFLYYFMDYFLGQFYIYVRYIIPGYIVIFDRYYYDMIIDRKRSNIMLSPNIIRQGLIFILKPEINFFLFAKPSIIRSRKPELEIDEIEELTRDYTELFSKIKSRSKTNFVSIENLEIASTMGNIEKQLDNLLF